MALTKVTSGVRTLGADEVVAANVDDDAVGIAELSATGTASATTFLRGDNSWQTAGVSTIAALTDATVSSSDPTISTNPAAVGHFWINSTSGESYVATDITSGANHWKNIGDGTGAVTPLSVQYLVVAGGGGGGAGSWGGGTGGFRAMGGGGAGGYRTNMTGATSGKNSSAEAMFFPTLSQAYTITVGAGGAAASYGNENAGSDSVFNTITSIGGGPSRYFTAPTANPNNGGCGGGRSPTGDAAGAGTANQGFGGGSSTGASPGNAGGGGGAGEIGEDGSGTGATNGGGDGGDGIASTITGASVYRSGGGGAGGGGTGGNGGGADGPTASSGTSYAGVAATANTGGGGSGAAGYTSLTARDGGAGGSGIVLLKIEDNGTATFSGGVTSTVDTSTVSGYKIYTVTATSSTSETVTFTTS